MKKGALDAAFSLLPRRNADLAMRHLIDRMGQPVGLEAFEIRWAEFELSGRFLRGGISDITDLVTIVVSNSQSDAGISLLARRAAAENLTPGLIEWADDGEQFLWYLPYRFVDGNGKAGTRLRGLLITSHLFGEIMELFNGDANLTLKEKRTLFQLVGGMELRDAARTDAVSYETKRAHTKIASEKLGCGGQKELIRTAMGQLVHLMSVSDSELRHTEPAVRFTETYLHEDMHLIVRHNRSGATLRYLVGGPTGGMPAILVHGMMFPIILRGISKFLDRHNIRLYVPIRPGYLESRALGTLFDQGDIIEQGIREIAYIAEEEGLPRVPLIGNSLGAAVALRLALESPHRFSGLILISPNLARPANDDGQENSTFYKGMQDLKSDLLLFKLVNLEYRKFYSDGDTCRHILKTHFSRCRVDLDVMDGRYCGHAAYRMFASIYKSSIVGVAEDFRYVMSKDRTDANKLEIPLSIIHGEYDPLTSWEEVIREFGAPKRGVECLVAGAGHFASASHGNEVWRAVAEACRLPIETGKTGTSTEHENTN